MSIKFFGLVVLLCVSAQRVKASYGGSSYGIDRREQASHVNDWNKLAAAFTWW